MPVPTIAIFIGQAIRSGSWIGCMGIPIPNVQRHSGRRWIAAAGRSAEWPVEQLVAQQLADGLEAVAPGAQRVDDPWEGGEGLLARAAAVVHEHDRARPGVGDDVRIDRRRAWQRPIGRVDVPVDRLQAERARRRDHARVDGAARRPEEAWLEARVLLDPRGGPGDLPVVRIFDVVHRVVADLVAFGQDPAHRRFTAGHLLADLEEGRPDVLFAQDGEEPFGVFARAVVEGEGDDLALRRRPGDKFGAPAGAADGADGTQPEGPRAGRWIGDRAAAADLATAVAREHAPVVMAGAQAGGVGWSGDHREHELVRARS